MKKDKSHYIRLLADVQEAGVQLFSRKRKSTFTPTEKAKLTRFVNENAHFVAHRAQYKASDDISKKEYEYIRAQGGTNFTAHKVGKNKYRVFARNSIPSDKITLSTTTEKIGRKKYKVLSVQKTGKRRGRKIGVREKFFATTNKEQTAVAMQGVLDETESIIADGGAIRVRVNGTEWSVVFDSVEQLQAYVSQQAELRGGNLWAGVEVLHENLASGSPAERRRRAALRGQRNKRIRIKDYDE